ncbi:hypothetical protein BSKO_06089 [Bryopsis sp. KO-2023]|nr:hypothetical protein BSKO_06089 [Bryopsis sp. KO-2023]
MDRLVALVVVVLGHICYSAALPDLCRCGSVGIPSGGFESVSEVTSLIYPGTSGHHRENVEEALLLCNPDLGSTGSLERTHVVLPCLFPEDEHFRPKFEDYAHSCGCDRTHRVADGQTLWSIASEAYPREDAMVAAHLIMGCNPSMNPNALVEGQNLQMYCFDGLLGLKEAQQREAYTGRVLLAEKSKHKDIYVKEGCPTCDVAPFAKKKRGEIADKSLHECGCDDKCADCAVNFVNGCTSTFGARFEGAFEDTVRPACFMHDACYSCGDVVFKKAIKSRDGRRKKCDDLMREKMYDRCDQIYEDQSRLRSSCRFAASTYHKAARLLGGSFFRKKCKCPKGWTPYVNNLYQMDFCVQPVREGFRLPKQSITEAAKNAGKQPKKKKNGKKQEDEEEDDGLFASIKKKAGDLVG